MCGFAGFLNPSNGMTAEQLKATVTDMSATIRHRGPDDAGDWIDADAGIAIGFRRLAIMERSTISRCCKMPSAISMCFLKFRKESR